MTGVMSVRSKKESLPFTTTKLSSGVSMSRMTFIPGSICTSSPAIGKEPDFQVPISDQYFALGSIGTGLIIS